MERAVAPAQANALLEWSDHMHCAVPAAGANEPVVKPHEDVRLQLPQQLQPVAPSDRLSSPLSKLTIFRLTFFIWPC
jgi:hypothetical protein